MRGCRKGRDRYSCSSWQVRGMALLALLSLLLPVAASAQPLDTCPGVAGPIAHPHARHVERMQYNQSTMVSTVVSTSGMALLRLTLSGGREELVLHNAISNHSKVVEIGARSTFVRSIIPASTGFLAAWQYKSNGTEFYETLTLRGQIARVSIPALSGGDWQFLFGNGSDLFAARGGPYSIHPISLLEINPLNFALISNDSKNLPSGLTLNAVLPSRHSVYLAGYDLLPGPRTPYAYFGFINRSNGHLTNVTTAPTSWSSSLFGQFDSLAFLGNRVIAGGYLLKYWPTGGGSVRTIGGYLELYAPKVGTFSNLSSLIPVPTWGVFGLAPWGSGVGLNIEGFSQTSSTTFTTSGGIYSLQAGAGTLYNHTSLEGPGFVGGTGSTTAGSGGEFFEGGHNSGSGLAELIAVRT